MYVRAWTGNCQVLQLDWSLNRDHIIEINASATYKLTRGRQLKCIITISTFKIKSYQMKYYVHPGM